MMRIGSRSLGRIDRERCDRAGSYRRDGLAPGLGADIMRASSGLLEGMRRAVYGPRSRCGPLPTG